MMKKAALIVVGTLLVVACGQSYAPSSPSQLPGDGSSPSSEESTTPTSTTTPVVERSSHFVHATGGFSCIDAVLQGPLSVSINPNHPGPCLKDEGIRPDTAAR
jgi:hypothetical protein